MRLMAPRWGAQLPAARPSHALGQLREAVLRGAPGPTQRVRRSGQRRPVGEGGAARLAEDGGRMLKVFESYAPW